MVLKKPGVGNWNFKQLRKLAMETTLEGVLDSYTGEEDMGKMECHVERKRLALSDLKLQRSIGCKGMRKQREGRRGVRRPVNI